jgi:hypothetical protein
MRGVGLDGAAEGGYAVATEADGSMAHRDREAPLEPYIIFDGERLPMAFMEMALCGFHHGQHVSQAEMTQSLKGTLAILDDTTAQLVDPHKALMRCADVVLIDLSTKLASARERETACDDNQTVSQSPRVTPWPVSALLACFSRKA